MALSASIHKSRMASNWFPPDFIIVFPLFRLPFPELIRKCWSLNGVRNFIPCDLSFSDFFPKGFLVSVHVWLVIGTNIAEMPVDFGAKFRHLFQFFRPPFARLSELDLLLYPIDNFYNDVRQHFEAELCLWTKEKVVSQLKKIVALHGRKSTFTSVHYNVMPYIQYTWRAQLVKPRRACRKNFTLKGN